MSQLFPATLKREHVAKGDVEQALRETNCALSDMKYVFLEADGKITVLYEE